MIKLTTNYWAVYEDGRAFVQAWSDNGDALILDSEAGRLVPAHEVSGFLAVEASTGRYIAAVPADGWAVRYGTEAGGNTEPVICWLVQDDGGVDPVVGGADGHPYPLTLDHRTAHGIDATFHRAEVTR
jgi:hypothetical protein